MTVARLAALFILPLTIAAAQGCSAAPDGEDDSEELVGAEETDTFEGAASGSHPVGTTMTTTANLNLRSGPSTDKSIFHVIPQGAKVTLVASDPVNGWYNIDHDGTVGWSSGQYLTVSDGGQSSSAREAAIGRAKSAKGFSYWWGHARFRPEGPTNANKGSCSGSCPSCSHSGSYGGDCSGLAGKVWEVTSNKDLTVDQHPYSTVSFNSDTNQWYSVARANMKKADMMVYNSNGAGHIFVYDSGDPWNSLYAYECKGCSYGCIAGYRTASNAYHGIRRSGY